MNLISNDELAPLLACPRCHASLREEGGAYRCSGCGKAYPVVGGQPVLVDFEDSILVEDHVLASGAASTIRRGKRSGWKRVLVATENKMAARNANRLLETLKAQAEKPLLLIVGGGMAGVGTEALYEDPQVRLLSFDIYRSPLTQFVADGHQIPLADQSVDGVWIQAVLEHVLDPWKVVEEIHRVLKPNGVVYAETPFMQQVHEGAYDFTRFTDSGHRWMFRRFEAIDSGVVLGSGTQLTSSIEHVVRGLFRSVKAGQLARIPFFWLRYFDGLIPSGYSLDAASAVYFLGRKSEVAIRPRDMVGYYKGGARRAV